MKLPRVILIIFSFAMPISTFAGQTEYDDCILEHLKGLKLDISADLIKQACNENYKSSSFTSDKKRTYNHCLLEHLTGVESLQAVMDIKAACSSKYK